MRHASPSSDDAGNLALAVKWAIGFGGVGAFVAATAFDTALPAR